MLTPSKCKICATERIEEDIFSDTTILFSEEQKKFDIFNWQKKKKNSQASIDYFANE